MVKRIRKVRSSPRNNVQVIKSKRENLKGQPKGVEVEETRKKDGQRLTIRSGKGSDCTALNHRKTDFGTFAVTKKGFTPGMNLLETPGVDQLNIPDKFNKIKWVDKNRVLPNSRCDVFT
ncbi:hypothetical protein RUM43_002124 [Polyplax serrata]|uniref:Uncharacterized protein n=1 Tax=Polyplax serrata TaxID=468196 RepID=A0AAN8S4G8_POLSC